MGDSDNLSPLPFRRERNLSNRNFNKRNSNRRRLSTEKHSTQQQEMHADAHSKMAVTNNDDSSSSSSFQLSYSVNSDTENAFNQRSLLKMRPAADKDIFDRSSSSSFKLSYSVNSDTENAFNQRSLLKMRPATDKENDHENDGNPSEPPTPTPTTMHDPAFLDVRQKVQRFETLKTTMGFFKTERLSLKLLSEQRQRTQLGASNKENHLGQQEQAKHVPRRLLGELRNKLNFRNSVDRSTTTTSIDEVRSEDEVDNISDYEAEPTSEAGVFLLPELAHELKEGDLAGEPASCDSSTDASSDVHELGIDDFGKVEVVKRSVSADQSSSSLSATTDDVPVKTRNGKDFLRNYRSAPRRKTEVIGITNHSVIGKYHSVYQPKDDTNDEDDVEEEIELRDKSDKCVDPILEELIHTEEAYVENLRKGLENYGNIFHRKDLPVGLRGKQYDLLGNIEQISEFHRDEFLPMLHRNRRDLKRLFDEFQHFIETNCFYGYVIFTMNKQKSLKLCDVYKNYFKLIQSELDDKLGINSFLVQPIQRMARYPLLLTQFINTFFKNRDIVMKPLIESCCRLEKRLRTLLITTNESEIINDIVDCNEFNVLYQGKFRKVSEFHVADHTLKRNYRSKVFIFDKCIIYTEIKGKHLVFHGRYPCEHIGITAKTKSFTLFYQRRKQQECDFNGDPTLITTWLDLIRDMINNFANEERQKLQELYSRDNDHMHRKPPSLSLYRDSNRFSSDSGIGNIWVMPKPEEEQTNNRTTWYAST